MAPKLALPPTPPRLPLVLQQRSSEEYKPLPTHPLNLPVVAQVRAQGPKHAARLSMPLGDYWASRQGTAAALRALDEAWGGGFYAVPAEGALDHGAAGEALGGDQLVIDVQTHYVTDRRAPVEESAKYMLGLAESVAPERFKGLEKLARGIDRHNGPRTGRNRRDRQRFSSGRGSGYQHHSRRN